MQNYNKNKTIRIINAGYGRIMTLKPIEIKSHELNSRFFSFFKGNGHIVYNKSFFYNPQNQSTVFRFDLYSTSDHGCNNKCEVQLPGLVLNTQNFLYTPYHNFNYVDFNVDENGESTSGRL